MNKELTPLEALERIKSHYNDKVCVDVLDDFDIIEKSLKRLENYEKNEDFNKDVLAYAYLLSDEEKIKKLKALEIIKEIAKSYDIDFCDNKQTMSFKIMLCNKFILETITIKDKIKYDLLKEELL